MKQISENVSALSNERRNAYVIQHLTAAILTLLRDKPIRTITISELCKQAGVGRASFYRNYERKEDILKEYVLKEYVERIFHEWADGYKQKGDLPISELIQLVFAHFLSYAGIRTEIFERLNALTCRQNGIMLK